MAARPGPTAPQTPGLKSGNTKGLHQAPPEGEDPAWRVNVSESSPHCPARGSPSDYVVPVRHDTAVAFDFTRIGERRFEDLCRAVAVHVLGPGIEVFGDGPDGGREAAFRGAVAYPSTDLARGWNGYIVVQAKYRRQGEGNKDADWLCREITKELSAWSATGTSRVRHGELPEYLIIATNVRLSSVAGRGGRARVRAHLDELGSALGLKGHATWDANQLTTYLNAYHGLATHFTEAITPGAVFAGMKAKLDQLHTTPATTGRRLVGKGGPEGMGRAFLAAYRRAGGLAVLGEATSEVYGEGPGWVQRFGHCADGGSAVICALSGRPAVAVDAEIWEALGTAGAVDGWFAAAGFPEVTDRTPPVIGLDSASIELSGGRWGPGCLVPQNQQWWQHARQWEWQPRELFPRPREGARWIGRGDQCMDLRLRCAVRFGWKTPVVIDESGPRRLREALADDQCPLNWLVPELAELFQLPVPELIWEPAPPAEGQNDARHVSYRQRLLAPNGRPAIGAWVHLEGPGLSDWTTLALVDVRVDFAAMHALVPVAAEALYRPTAADLHEVFQAAVTGATRVLPLVLRGGPSHLRPSGPTVAELHLDWERTAQQSELSLIEALDLDLFGEPPADLGSTMSTAMVLQPSLSDHEISDLTFQMLIRMASHYRFVPAEG